MKNLNLLLLLSITTGILFMMSCKKKLDGGATAPGFEKSPIILNGEAQEIILKAKNVANWSISDINLNNEGVISGSALEESKDIIFYSTREKQPMPNPYYYLVDIYKLESTWFVWEKINSLTIKFTVNKNGDNKPRIFDFTAFAGNAQDNIRIIQYPLDK